MFLSADLDSIEYALLIGVPASQAAALDQTLDGMWKAMASASERVKQYHQILNSGASFEKSDWDQQQAERRRRQKPSAKRPWHLTCPAWPLV